MRKFNEEEIKEIVRTAQIFASQFTEDQYHKLVQMQQEAADPEFIETAWGVYRIRKQYGIPLSQVLDKNLQLIKDNAALELKSAQLKERQALQEKQLAETTAAVQWAKEQRDSEEKELQAFRRQAQHEKKRLQEELAQARREARVSHEQVDIAGRINALVQSHGLDLDVSLRLFEEFAHDEDAGGHLAQAVAEHGSLLKALQTVREQNEAQQAELDKGRQESDNLKAECQHHGEVLSQLRSDLAKEEALRRFHKRFSLHSPALEYLARWEQVIPLRCTWILCGARFWVNRGPSNFRTTFVCPCCGLGPAQWDDDAFKTLGIPPGGPFKITLGE
jgi:hypothetical protein